MRAKGGVMSEPKQCSENAKGGDEEILRLLHVHGTDKNGSGRVDKVLPTRICNESLHE